MVKINSEEELDAWLKTRPPEDDEIIAHRAALRVFPNWGRAMQFDWARKGDLTALPILRMTVTSTVERKYPTPEVKAASASAFASAASAASASASALSAARSAAAYAASAANRAAAAASAFYASAASATATASATDSASAFSAARSAAAYAATKIEMWQHIQTDCDTLLTSGNLETTPLWHGPAPDWFTKANAETHRIWDQDPEPWIFWRRWWQSRIDGTNPFPDDLLRDIALIPNDVWNSGPPPVAEHIDLLIQRRALLRELEALKEVFTRYLFDHDSLGKNLHNRPPEDEESPSVTRAKIEVIVKQLEAIEVALSGPTVDPEVVRSLGERLLESWNGLTKKTRMSILAVTVIVLTGVPSGFGSAAGEELYQAVRQVDVVSFVRRLTDFAGKTDVAPVAKPYFGPK